MLPRGKPQEALGGWILAALLAAATPAAASSFGVAPIRVELGSGHARGVLTLRNDGDTPVTVQVETVGWSQPQGTDQYSATSDLITTPPVFVVAAKSQQIVRVALRRDADATRELAYRLFFQEVPQSADPAVNGLRVALRLGVPVFVAPSTNKPAPALTWKASLTSAGELQIEARNQGTAHLQVTGFELTSGSQQPVRIAGARYVLPDSAVSWKATMPPGFDPSQPLHIHGQSDQGEISADIARVGP
jgi:fimbrial chaperone protein